MKVNRKLAVYYKYREQEIDIRNNLLVLFDLYENYIISKYKSVGNYLRYKGYQSIAVRIIYKFEYGTVDSFLSMMEDIYNISKDLHNDLQRILGKKYSEEMIKTALYNATHLTNRKG